MKSKIMSGVGILIFNILKATIGKRFHSPDHQCDKYFHYLSGSIEMFKFPSRNTLGIHIPENEDADGHIFMIHQHLKSVLIKLEEENPYTPDVVVTFRIKKDGTILPLLGGEGSRRINMLMFDHGLKEMLFKLQEEIPKAVSEYNLRKLKSTKKKK